MKSMQKLIILLIHLVVSFSYGADAISQDPSPVLPPEGLVPDNLLLFNSDEFAAKNVIIADKERRTLTVWKVESNTPKLIGTYPIDIGKSQGAKTLRNDFRTPEGIYFIQNKLEGAGLNFDDYGKRAFTLDYPNYFDQLAGKTGSGIWLHAVPDTTPLTRGSRGCVVVRNEIIDQLTPYIQLKRTPVVIVDKVNYVTPDALATLRKSAQDWLESWRSAWEAKNLANYMNNYADGFRALKMNKNQWHQYKEALNKKYSYIKVKLSNPIVLARKNEAVFQFVQEYDSDGLKDTGEKTLFVNLSSPAKFEIVTELWRPLGQDLLAKKQKN